MRIRFLPLLAAGLLPALSFVSAGCGNSATSTPPSDSAVGVEAPESSSDSAATLDSDVVTVSAESPASESAADDAANETAGKKKPTNRLARETSPYLLLHAHNPVDWYPWGAEAFEKAKRENKPIFLSIGYSSCYWCHVMERLVFMNSKIAEYMNENFVNVKVDREERPDVDDIYMTSLHVYLQLSGSPGGGGWPLSMFLTPDGKPIAGGTYFPPEDKGGRFGFPTIMKKIVEAWTTQNDSVLEGAETITNIVKREMRPGIVLEKPELTRSLVDSIAGAMVQSHDPEFGGIDFRIDNPNAPKFPVPTKLAFLQYQAEVHGSREAEHALYHTLDAMAEGGIRDHLGGGFHRYSTDRQWLVPHFEKMLYDNAQLADVYTAAYQATKNRRYREVAEEIFTYVLSDMTEPNGAFHSALDAETDAVEGLYYVWSKEEIDRLLGADAELFSKVYGLDGASVFEHGYVLHLATSVEKVADAAGISVDDLNIRLFKARRTLLEFRRKRETPLKDDKILTSWNGLMIRALANAGIVFGKRQYLDAAEKSAEFILKSMRDDEGRLLRTWRVETARLNAYLDDYAFLVDGLLTLHLATRDRKWLNASRHLTDDQIRMFRDTVNGGFYFTSHHHEQLLARTKNCWDSVLPSGNSVSVRNLIRLASLTGDNQYRDYAQEILEMFAPQMKKNPRGVACMALALGEFLDNRDYRPLIDRIDPTDEKPKGTGNPPKESEPGPPGETGTSSGTSTDTSKTNAEADNQSVAGSVKPTEKLKKNRVSAEAYLSTDRLPAGRSCRIAVVLNVAAGWHINTNPAKPDFLVPTTVTLKSTRGTKLVRTSYPTGEELKVADSDAAYRVYSGKVTIIGEIEVPESAAGGVEEFELAIRYQSCNEQQCERPATIKFAARAAVADVDQPVNVVNATVFAGSAPKRTE